MQDFFATTEADATAAAEIRFGDGEIVRMQCLDFNSNAAKGSVTLRCKVLSGPHSGKTTSVFLNGNQNEVSQKIKSQFLLAFWTADEIKSSQCKPAKLIGRVFTVKSKVSVKKGDTSPTPATFQNWSEFTDIGAGETGAAPTTAPLPNVAAAPQQQSAQAVQSPTF